MGNGGSFPVAEAQPGRDADHLPLSSAEVEMSGIYISSPPKRFRGV
jgi:hypothetical protein